MNSMDTYLYKYQVKLLRNALFATVDTSNTISDILTKYKICDRLILAEEYNRLYKANLITDIQNELGGLFEDACIALLKEKHELYADIIHKTLWGDKFSLLPIIDIFFTHDNSELNEIKDIFNKKYGGELDEFLSKIKDDNLRKIAIQIISTNRDQSTNEADFYLAYQDAAQLNEAGLGLSIAKQSELLLMLCSHSYRQLALTLKIYEKVTRTKMECAIGRYFDGDLHDIFSSIVLCIRSREDYFATRIHNCLNEDNKDEAIIDIIISRSEIDLNLIQLSYKRLFNRLLHSEIQIKMKSSIRRLLSSLLNNNVSDENNNNNNNNDK